jgi:hypothetical protein
MASPVFAAGRSICVRDRPDDRAVHQIAPFHSANALTRLDVTVS